MSVGVCFSDRSAYSVSSVLIMSASVSVQYALVTVVSLVSLVSVSVSVQCFVDHSAHCVSGVLGVSSNVCLSFTATNSRTNTHSHNQ